MPNNISVYTGEKRKCALCGNEHLEKLEIHDPDGYPCRYFFADFLAELYACRYCGLVYIGSEIELEDPE